MVLEARGLNVGTKVHDVDLAVRRGEIVGLAVCSDPGRTNWHAPLAGTQPM